MSETQEQTRGSQTAWIVSVIAFFGICMTGIMTVENHRGCDTGWFGIETNEYEECTYRGARCRLGDSSECY